MGIRRDPWPGPRSGIGGWSRVSERPRPVRTNHAAAGARPHSFTHFQVGNMRRLNLVFLAVLLVVVALLGGGMHLVHGFQVRRNASAFLDRAHRAEAKNDLETAEESLGQYLNLRRDDASAWEWYARVVDQRNSDRGRPQRV